MENRDHAIAVSKRTGRLNKVSGLSKFGHDQCDHKNFTDHSKVMNGFSDLMVEVLERKENMRDLMGMCSFPFGIA